MIKLFCIIINKNIFHFEETINDNFIYYFFKNGINENIKNLLKYYSDNDEGYYEINIKCEDEFKNINWIEKYKLYLLKKGQKSYFIISDNIIKTRIIYELLINIHNNIIQISEVMKKYTEPEKQDKIYLIKKNIDDTKDIIINNLTIIFDRNEKIEDMIKNIDDMNDSSLEFYRNSRQSCCRYI